MSSKYDKTVSMTREEEGTYHRREIEHPPISGHTTSKPTYTTQSYQVVSRPRSNHGGRSSGDEDNDNFEEWTTSKRKVNHKTRQVETRVSRQILVEDGKVIADSGPQVTTRIKEDNKVEECEKEKAPKNKGKFDEIECAPVGESVNGRVLGEKKEIQRVSREVREENMQYHDERFKELTGHDVHRRAIQSPHELITITDKGAGAPRGKMVHYSNKGKKYQDTDEILEVAKLAIDGSITKEVKRTKHHEEFSEDEKPDETGEAEALRKEPIVTRSSRRHVDYVNDFDDTSRSSSDDETTNKGRPSSGSGSRRRSHSGSKTHARQHHHKSSADKDEQAFPRYEIDPLLNSLNDDDFRPISSNHSEHFRNRSASGRYKEHRLERKDRSDSASEDDDVELRPSSRHSNQLAAVRQRSPSPYNQQPTSGRVEIPEEYRVNKQRLLSGRGKSSSAHERERSFSPTNKSHLSQVSHRSSKSRGSRKEDASVQAHLTDEEEERKSARSSLSGNSHEKTTRQLQRQSTTNSSRNYYFGEKAKANKHRSPSLTSSSSSSLSDPKERLRKEGARSKDSGFKSPHSHSHPHRTTTPISRADSQQQIYSVSSKSKRNRQQETGPASPTPTAGSLGQRSVKTTTTTVAAGLADRPLSRNSDRTHLKSPAVKGKSKSSEGGKVGGSKRTLTNINHQHDGLSIKRHNIGHDRQSLDTVSLSSLGPNATTIKVPYRRPVEEEEQDFDSAPDSTDKSNKKQPFEPLRHQMESDGSIRETESQLNIQGDIENLRKRLANISSKKTEIGKDGVEREYFDYKTVVANVQSVPAVPRQHVIDAYNVRVIEHNSPFSGLGQKPIKSVNELSTSIAQLELLTSEMDSSRHLEDGTISNNANDNNNDADFNLNNYVKHKAMPAMTSTTDDGYMDDDRQSLASSADSLRSSRTYDIRNAGTKQLDEGDLNDVRDFPVEVQNIDRARSIDAALDTANGIDDDDIENDESKKRPAAWVFDLRDGSSTAIVAPPRPKKPEAPKIDSKTEELAQSRGGRAYYLELVEQNESAAKKAPTGGPRRPNSIDSLYSRWNSHSTLTSANSAQTNQARQVAKTVKSPATENGRSHRSRQIKPATILDQNSRPIITSNNSATNSNLQRRQLPFDRRPLGDRSKSSSCLIGSTKPTKYSIYGGLRKPNSENKPVPRLSYSRAIGPKSQRQIDAQPKTPSRYLKMR